MKHTLIVLILFFLPTHLLAQDFSIADGTISTCLGTLFDTGGQGGTGYGNSESFTITICPDNPTDIITLDFLNFSLDNTNTANPGNNVDNMTIYDGDNIGAATLGTYTNGQLQGTIVTCTSLNTTGCLTVVFNSNDVGTGVFAATITCSTPCQRPVAMATSSPDTIAKICKGESVSFDGSSSFAQGTFNIMDYHWDFDDGTIDSTSGVITNYTFNDEGAYVVQLYVIDDNGCINSNLISLNVWVAPDPKFNPMEFDTAICLGETATMTAHPEQYAQAWTAVPDGNLGGPQYVPDQVGQCFSTGLTFDAFNPGQTLTNVNDLLDICINFEHSFMGDLVISLYCPSGQSVILHQQNGGGTNLGDPDQADDPNLPGIGWNYCWSPQATNGTWEENSQFGITPNTMTNSTGSESLVPGTYESLNPMNSLVGCDLNGTWEIEFCDLWGADDGFVFSWAINLDPSLFPPLTSFTPEIGEQADSSFWTGPNITNTSANGNQITISPPAAGSYDYIYTVSDAHGCVNDTTVTLVVEPDPVADAGPDSTVCNGATIQLQGGVANTPPPAPACNFTIDLEDTFGDGWNGASIDLIINGTTTNYGMAAGTNASYTFTLNDGDSWEIIFNPGTFDNEIIYTFTDCNGNQIFSDGPNPAIGSAFTSSYGNPTAYTYSWSPATGLTNPNSAEPEATISGQMTYTLTVFPTGHPLCFSVDQVTINISNANSAGTDAAVSYCSVDPAVDMFTLLGGTPDIGGTWLDGSLLATSNIYDPASNITDIYAYVVGTSGCSDTAFIDVSVGAPFVLSVPNDTIVCENGQLNLFINASGGFGAPYTESWSQGLSGNGPFTFIPAISACYDVFVTDANGCSSPTETICVNINPPIIATASGVDSICSGDQALLESTAIGGNSGPYNYSWSTQGTVLGMTEDITVSPIVQTEYCVTVSDNCETTPVTECVTVNTYPQPEPVFTSDINDGCYPIDVTFTNNTDPGSIGTVSWDFGNGSTSSQTSGVQSTYNQPICYDVILTITSPQGCTQSEINTAMICPFDYPTADFQLSPNPTNVFDTDIYFTNTSSQDVINWQWDFGSETLPTSSIDENPTAIFPGNEPGTYPIFLIVTNTNGCTDTVENTLIVNSIFTLYIPNAFTPDGDGINDSFYAQGAAVSSDDFSLMIFDRWGELIFETTDLTKRWDGYFKNRQAPIGSYAWKVNAKDLYTNQQYEYYGHVLIIR
jgi:gliding motility-associated-like protein